VTQEGIKLAVGVSEYDGQAELCFDSVEEMNAAFNEPRFLAEVHPDDAIFIEIGKGVSSWSLRKSRKLPSGPFRALHPEIKAYDVADRYCEREIVELRGILTARLLELIGPHLQFELRTLQVAFAIAALAPMKRADRRR
jgi:EthD domain